jgi:putative DNA methylase
VSAESLTPPRRASKHSISTQATDSVLARLDPEQVSNAARRESRNREVHLPPLSTYRWWARRTGAVNDAVLDAAVQAFGRDRLDILDPFAGGGTIPLVALRAGHRVHAQDLNPWAAEGMRQMFSLPPAAKLHEAHAILQELAEPTLRKAYATEMSDGQSAILAHTYRVAVGRCLGCGSEHRQFPYSLLTLLHRKERARPEAILACPAGHIFEGRTGARRRCPECARLTDPTALYAPRRIVTCPSCGKRERLSDRASVDGWRWEMVLVERAGAGVREFGLPTAQELRQADGEWATSRKLGAIPPGAETNVLLRHGFHDWEDLYPPRQRAVIETLLELAAEASEDQATVDALRLAIVGTAEFAGHLCRWDRYYLKCNDATAGHRFNFSTFVPEINVWGAGLVGRGTVTRRVQSMVKAADWLHSHVRAADVDVVCGDSAHIECSPGSFDLVLTDPPYHDDVHYGELSLLFRAWAGLSTDQLEGEAATNVATGVNADGTAYAASLERIFVACHRGLRPGGRLIFSYANHEPRAWVALFAALQNAGFSAVACVSVHSENETDFKKRDVRSCTEDLLMELSPVPTQQDAVVLGDFTETPFMDNVATIFSRVGRLQGDWQNETLDTLRRARQDASAAIIPTAGTV